MPPPPILDPKSADPKNFDKCALAVMAKAPRAGKVKTRLSPPLTPAQTAALNICFLKDTTENLADLARSAGYGGVRAVGLVCYTPVGDEAAFEGLFPPDFALIAQRGEIFGDRLLAAAEDILACGFGSVCLIDSDSPTVPRAAFEKAVAELARIGDRVVLGPSRDGGYYLIGLKQAHAAVFEGISWSTSLVAAETRERCRAAGLELVELPVWYDVDDAGTLDVLCDELLNQRPPGFTSVAGYPAAHTREFLLELDPPDEVVAQPAALAGAARRSGA